MNELLIVGGGIGGLTLANALARLVPKLSVTVLDLGVGPSGGAVLGLRRQHGLQVLERLGLDAVAAGQAEAASGLRFVTSEGRPLLRFVPPPVRSPHFMLPVSRPGLHALLRDGLRGKTNVTVVDGVTVQRCGESGGRAWAEGARGERYEADVLVGFDGARSAVRASLGLESRLPTGLSMLSGLAAAPKHALLDDGSLMALGPGASVFVQTAGRQLLWALTSHDGAKVRDLGAARATLEGWHPLFAELVEATPAESVRVRPLTHHAAPRRAHWGRVALAGDASHAMTPFRGDGANMAMTDAWELAAALATGPTVEATLQRFERTMVPRNRAAVLRSARAAKSYHEVSPAKRALRNAGLRLLGVFVALVLAVALPVSAEPAQVKLGGLVRGCSGRHAVHVGVYGPKLFEAKPLKYTVLAASACTDNQARYSFSIEPGVYAVAAFEDVDGDGKLGSGTFGPSEPSGFFHAFKKWRAPTFDDLKFEANADVPAADVELH